MAYLKDILPGWTKCQYNDYIRFNSLLILLIDNITNFNNWDKGYLVTSFLQIIILIPYLLEQNK